MYYSDDIIEEVRARNPIVDVIGQYVHLQKKGANYFGLCPFHNEKSPSFSVSPSKQMYHCFGCGVGGNVLTFVMEYENYSFQEALKMLADRAGMTLPEQEYTPKMREEEDLRQTLLRIHKDAAVFFVHMLRSPEGKPGMDYLKKRGLSDDMIRSFGLGYTGRHPGTLYRYLKDKGYTDEQLKFSGLVTYRDRGASDVFWNRVMFPIMDANSRVIAFGGRVMGDGEPKYLNSQETKIFDKSRNLYGLHVARRTREKFFLVCEGYMDVIALHEFGFTNAVASLGTAFTAQHGMIIKRYTDEVVLCFDSDGAGHKAAIRAIPILKEAGLKIRVLNMSPYKDPDEFCRNLGTEEFRKRIDAAQNSFIFELSVLKESIDFNDPEDKAAFFNEAASRIAALPDDIERNVYTEAVANTWGIDYGILKSQVSKVGNSAGFVTARREETVRPKTGVTKLKSAEQGIREAQKLVLTALSEDTGLYQEVRGFLSPDDFSDDTMKKTAEMLFEQIENDHINPAAIMDRFLDSEKYREVAELFSSRYLGGMNEDERKKAVYEAMIRIREESLDRKIGLVTDPSELMDLLTEKQKLKNRKPVL